MFMMPIPEMSSAMVETRIRTIVKHGCDGVGRLQDRYQILHVVLSASAMTALQNLTDLFGDSGYIGCISHLHVDRLNLFVLHEVLHHRDGNQYCFITDFALSKRCGFFAKRADHSELQLADFDGLSDGRILAAEYADGQFSVSMATRPRNATSLASRARPRKITSGRTTGYSSSTPFTVSSRTLPFTTI